MTIFIARDDNPEGGYYSFGPERPNRAIFRGSHVQVKKVEGHDDLWDRWNLGELPVDEDGTLDEVLAPLWASGVKLWDSNED